MALALAAVVVRVAYVYTRKHHVLYIPCTQTGGKRNPGILVGNALHTQLRIQGNIICASARTHNMDSGVVLFGGGGWFFSALGGMHQSPR